MLYPLYLAAGGEFVLSTKGTCSAGAGCHVHVVVCGTHFDMLAVATCLCPQLPAGAAYDICHDPLYDLQESMPTSVQEQPYKLACTDQSHVLQGFTAIVQRFEPVLILADCIQVVACSLHTLQSFLLLDLFLERVRARSGVAYLCFSPAVARAAL